MDNLLICFLSCKKNNKIWNNLLNLKINSIIFYGDPNIDKPFIYEKLNSEKSIKLLKKYSINNSENNTLIYDLMEYINIKNNTLYFTDIYEEYIDLKQKNKINNSNNINYLLKKHFPYSNLNFNL